MATSLRTLIISTGTALLLGLGAGYWLGQNPSADVEMTTVSASTTEAATINPEATAAIHSAPAVSATPTTVAIGPAGLRLVGTIVDADRKKSKAWLQEIKSEATQAFAEGDSLSGGYLIESIGSDMLIASKDGQQYVIRRSSTPSASTTSSSAPDIGYAHSVEREARTGRDYVDRPSAASSRNQREQTIKGSSIGERSVRPMSAKSVAGWKDADQSENANDGTEHEEPAAKDSE